MPKTEKVAERCSHCKGEGQFTGPCCDGCAGCCDPRECLACAGTGKEPDWELRIKAAKAVGVVHPGTEMENFQAACSMGFFPPFDQDIKAAWSLLERWLEADERRGFDLEFDDAEAVVTLRQPVNESVRSCHTGVCADEDFEAAVCTAICRALVAAGGE